MASNRVDRFMKGLARILRNTNENKPVSLNLLALEERLNPAPNLLVPSTSAAAPIGVLAGSTLPFSGALALDLLDTPNPASTSPFTVSVTASAGTVTASASGSANVSGAGTGVVTLSGSLADIRASLASLSYANVTPGTATLTVAANDSGSTVLSDSKTIFLSVANSATSPTITTALANVGYYAEATTVTEAAISFTVSDPNGSAGVVVTGTSSNTNLILNTDIVVAGTYPNFTVTLKHQANVTGTALITLKVSDGTNFTTKSFNVSVAPSAQYYWDIVAGNGTAGITNGTGTAATFNGPWQIAVDTVNNLYVADYNSGTIRKITPAGVVTTIAGSATTGYLDNADPLLAKFNKPLGVAVDDSGNVYVSEYGGYIRKIAYNSGNATYGPVSTLVSSLGGTTTLWNMLVVTPDGSTVYVAKVSDKKIYKIDVSANTGTALTAAFAAVPNGLSFDNNGNLLVREMTTGFTYQVTPAGVVTTLNSSVQYGNAQAIQLADGSYLSALNNTISRISMPNKAVVVGGGGAAGVLGLGAAAGFADIRSIVDAPTGFIYVSDWSATQNKIRVGKPYPSLLNPGTQSTTEGTRLAFSSANLSQLGAFANASDNSNVKLALTYKLSVQNGTLDFNNVAAPVGVTVNFATGNRSVTITGNETAVNAYMLNFGYTPDANYINVKADGTALASGAASPDVLSLTVTTDNNLTNPVTGSLNL
ncbi:MAG: hypothetical protein NTZ71_19475, partial [Planctomycetota bacterium]|nr:hypothetical protein [Planctomycetota bacterium]